MRLLFPRLLVLYSLTSVEAVLLDEGGNELSVTLIPSVNVNDNKMYNSFTSGSGSTGSANPGNHVATGKKMKLEDSGSIPGESSLRPKPKVKQEQLGQPGGGQMIGPNHCTMDGLFCLPANYSKYAHR